jgi:4-amino-4-deoxy-L-arabinose transferase-like glycosyltransferase
LASINLSENICGDPDKSLSEPTKATLVSILILVFLWRIFLTYFVNLIPDECSYWAWSRRLDWSYFDNSGMVAYLIRLSTWTFQSNTPFAVRFPFLVLSALTTYLIFSISLTLFKKVEQALLAALAFNLTPVALLGGSAAIHDNALIFFWCAALWALARLIRTGDRKLFLPAGLAAGFSILSKYTGVLVVLCILLFLITSREHRGLLLKREPWMGLLLAIVLCLPIIWWNIAHEWASLFHIFYIGTGSTSLSKRLFDGLGYHVAQIAIVSPLIYFAVSTTFADRLTANLRTPRPEELLLLSFGLPLLIFGLLAFKGHVEANWAIMGYAGAIILCVYTIYNPRPNPSNRLAMTFGGGKFQRRAMLWSLLPVGIVFLHGWMGLLPAFVEKRVSKEDRIIWETRCWDALGTHVQALTLPEDVIAADSYQLCALLEYNMPGNPMVRYLAPWDRPTQWDVWNPSFDDLKGKNILFVSSKPLEPSNSSKTTVYENFAMIQHLPTFSVQYHGDSIRNVFVTRCINFDPFQPRGLGPRSLFYKHS